jgi:hypothetical protein
MKLLAPLWRKPRKMTHALIISGWLVLYLSGLLMPAPDASCVGHEMPTSPFDVPVPSVENVLN